MKHQVRTQPTEDKSVCKNCYPYSNHVQILGQIGLFRVALSLGFKPARLRTTKTPQAPAPLLHYPHGEKVSSYLQPKVLVFQLVPLPLALYSYTAVKAPALHPHHWCQGCCQEPTSCPFSQLKQTWPHSLSFQAKGHSPQLCWSPFIESTPVVDAFLVMGVLKLDGVKYI